jgi:penicillin amidase
MRITRRRRRLTVDGVPLEIGRTTGAVVEIWAEDDLGLAVGLGFAHGHDRLVQMELVRLAAQGRLGECLRADEQTLAVDLFMRDLGVARTAAADADHLPADVRAVAGGYAAGVNFALAHCPRPLELRLVRHRPAPWEVADTLAVIGLMSYVGLAQTQQDMEKLIVEAIHGGVPAAALKRLFAPHLDGLDEAMVELLRRVRLERPLLPPALRFHPAVPTTAASNSWAVAGRRSASGFPLFCTDPHLEVNRLPAIWYEAVLHTADDYRIGATMPGVPGVVMGRTRELGFGFTYGYMDTIDLFVEEIRDGRCRREGEWRLVSSRAESVGRRGGSPVEITLRSTDHGVLETDLRSAELPDGLYLARAWSGERHGHAASLAAICRLPQATDVAAAQALLRQVTISCNWVLADRSGSIGFQQSGQLPVRRHSGLHPAPGWDPIFAWQGLVPPERLVSHRDPPEGLVASANDEVNPTDGTLALNLPMGPARVDRIRALLGERERLTLADMKRVQLDLHSLHAEPFMALFRPLLPETPAGRLLAEWDLRYDRASRGATLFEEVYRALRRRVFGDGLLGRDAWDAVENSTGLLACYFHFFDRALLEQGSPWYGAAGREAVLRGVLGDALGDRDATAVEPWGSRQRVTMLNVLFAGALPGWLGFDHGPVELAGGRGTVVQGGVFAAHGRRTCFAPSWRCVTDLGSDRADTALAGGPSGRRFSGLYTTDVERWLTGEYKTLEGSAPGPR